MGAWVRKYVIWDTALDGMMSPQVRCAHPEVKKTDVDLCVPLIYPFFLFHQIMFSKVGGTVCC